MDDLVSVIIPTYNRSQFVTEAIDSVLCQTYPNIELIVVNDGSTDDTEEKIQPYMDRIIYVKKENGGASSAVNAGLQIAKGKYVARLDGDDLFMPDKIEKQVTVFEKNPNVGMVISGCFVTDSQGRPISVRRPPDFSEYCPFLTLLLKYSILQPMVMVRRECHDKLGFYKDTFAEDYEMFLRISRHCGVAVVDQPLAKYRRHAGNMTRGLSENEELLQDMGDFIRDILDDVQLAELFPAVSSTSDLYRRSCAYAAKGALYLGHKLFDRAEANLSKALELCPTNPILTLWSGICARAREDFQSAERYFSRIQEDSELYPIARGAKDLAIALQKGADRYSDPLRVEITKEYRSLFRIAYDGISGKIAGKTIRHGSAPGLRLSRYSVIINDYPENGKHVMFNTFTRAMVNIGNDLKDFIYNSNPPVEQDALKNLRMLKRMGILVDESDDETRVVRKWYDIFRNDISSVDATILTTYDCNFACKYCIEEGVKKPVYMDDKCSDSLADWLISRAKENRTEVISLSFYGGEPLLNTRPIYRISEKLQRFGIENGILVSSRIITNGSLIDGKLLEDLTEYGLKSVKVTIDGVKEIHDSRRPFKGGKGSFDLVMENVRKIPESVELTIQANLDEENVTHFPCLLDFFEKSGLKDRIDNLTVSAVAQPIGSPAIFTMQGSDCRSLSDSPIAEELTYMKRLLVERGFKSKHSKIRHVLCSMNRNGSVVVIDPFGIIYSCPAFVGRERFSIGDIYHSEPGQAEKSAEGRLEGCFQCTYFPICGGGCRHTAYVLYGDHNRIACERRFIEHQTHEMIKLIYDQKVKQRTVS